METSLDYPPRPADRFGPLASLAAGCGRLLGSLRLLRDGALVTTVDDALRAADRALAAAERVGGTTFARPEAARTVTLEESVGAARAAVWSIGRAVGDGEDAQTLGCSMAIAREALADIRHRLPAA